MTNLEKIDTYGVKYIGSKKKLLENISALSFAYAKDQKQEIKSAIDVFTGTTRVAQYFRQLGVKTYTSDLSWASSCYANTFIHNGNNAHLEEHIQIMNGLRPIHGWLSENYSGNVPVEEQRGEGRCWQPKNTRKADAARDYVESLDLPRWEKDTLITSIIFALDKVDNTVGVQQAYLKEWCSRSYKDIVFELPPCISGPTAEHFCGNALTIDYPKADMAYLDPPYSPHSYSTYYHIWDSIYRWDKPETSLTARRRIDRVARHDAYDPSMESKWNLHNKAINAFEELIARLPVRYVVISYNDESIVNQEDLRFICEKYDKTKNLFVREISYRRNIMSQIGNAAKDVDVKKNQTNKELIIIIDKTK